MTLLSSSSKQHGFITNFVNSMTAGSMPNEAMNDELLTKKVVNNNIKSEDNTASIYTLSCQGWRIFQCNLRTTNYNCQRFSHRTEIFENTSSYNLNVLMPSLKLPDSRMV